MALVSLTGKGILPCRASYMPFPLRSQSSLQLLQNRLPHHKLPGSLGSITATSYLVIVAKSSGHEPHIENPDDIDFVSPLAEPLVEPFVEPLCKATSLTPPLNEAYNLVDPVDDPLPPAWQLKLGLHFSTNRQPPAESGRTEDIRTAEEEQQRQTSSSQNATQGKILPNHPWQVSGQYQPIPKHGTSQFWSLNPLDSLQSWTPNSFLNASQEYLAEKEEKIEEEIEEIIEEAERAHMAFASVVKDEIVACCQLVRAMGRGVVYVGSSRIPRTHKFYKWTQELSKEISLLLGSTCWSGIGPGLMDAAARGAMEVNGSVAGFKILMEANQVHESWKHEYLPQSSYSVCKSISARKQGFIEAVSRKWADDKTAFIALPGGIGTLDEIFEILTLVQLKKLETVYEFPIIAMSYDGCLDGLLTYVKSLESYGGVAEGEFNSLCKVCHSNLEALEYLADFYEVEESRRGFRGRIVGRLDPWEDRLDLDLKLFNEEQNSV